MALIKQIRSIAAVGAFLGSITLIAASIAQELPPIYATIPTELAPTEPIASFPKNTFLENVIVNDNGDIYITSHEDGKVIRLNQDGTKSVYATVPGKVAGLAFADDGSLLVSGANREGVAAIFQVTPDGTVNTLLTLPEAVFLNGLTPLQAGRYLVADSYAGVIWEFDTAGSSKVWLKHPLLARKDTNNPIPAVNGIKRFNDTLYASNTAQMLMLKIPINAAGDAGEPKIFLEQVNIDDFAFDQAGNLYGATHIYNSVLRVTPNQQITTIAQAEQGVIGSTAVAFGQTATDRTKIYVVTNGGMFLPPASGVVPAEVVRLDVRQAGHPLNQSASR